MRYLALIWLFAVAACAEEQHDPGREIYMGYCVSCHGADATGNGVLADDLPLAPANLTALSAANGGVFPTSSVMAKIHGYPGRYQSHVMPEFGPILEGSTVIWTDEKGEMIETPQALLNLAEYLASIQVQ